MKLPLSKFRFSLREILFAMVAAGALLGWWVNMPRWSYERTQFYRTFDPRVELESAQMKVQGWSHSGSGVQKRYVIRVDSAVDKRAAMDQLRTTIADQFEKEGLKQFGGGRGMANDYPHFDYGYRGGKIQGFIICESFPSTNPDSWQLLVVMQEVAMDK